MRLDQSLELKYIAVTLLVVASVVGVARLSKGEAGLCREVFQGLVKGRQSVQQRIDWGRLKAMGVDVGATYAHLPDERARAEYRRLFVEHFSKGFLQTGASLGDFVRWRVQTQTPEEVVVAVDYPAKQKTLLLTLPATGAKRIQAIQWQ